MTRALGVGLLLLFFAFVAALLSYDPADPSLNNSAATAVQNWLGAPGAIVADLLAQSLGLASLALLLPLAGWGWRLLSLRGLPWLSIHLLVLPLSVLALALALAGLPAPAAWNTGPGAGGIVGDFLDRSLAELWSQLGWVPPTWSVPLAAGGVALAALLATVGIARSEWAAMGRLLLRALHQLIGVFAALRRRHQEEDGDRQRRRARRTGSRSPTRRKAKVKAPARAREGARAAHERQGALFPEAGGFRLPPLDLLAPPPREDGVGALSREALEQNARLLESVLDDFGIRGRIGQVRPGPVVTLYELEPAPGTKSARVIGLADDIARSMSAISARVSVIPGRNAIGIELPNSRRETVLLREILASRAYETSKARLPLALGKDISGSPVIVDLAVMPHLLVAGTTGSGKSVGLNAMILSLLYRLPPERCRLILVDPKMLELSIYEGIPHLLTPVVTEPKKAVVALKWAVREMEERYRAMAKLGVRNLAAYNARVREAALRGERLRRPVQTGFDRDSGRPVYEEQEFDFAPLPIIVIVIDEMADLMLVAGKDVEAVVQRLAQMARAAGIHLIMATQRPSVDVITGTIKANFPTRISFQVTSKIDSRTILGEQGAEQLLGQGDMLFMAGGGRITRVHGAFVSDGEVEKVAAHLKTQGAPAYMEEVTEEPAEGFDSPFIPGPAGGDGENDASLYDRAVDIVLRDRRASTSYIQRRLRIGYNRAASLIEEMEEQGIIGPPNHAGKREILVPKRED
ncbi:MAG: cell division protein FtsK [Alphaproteobacteria bacterium]|nr:MAG: cell division protein FtsK [Alphaproteobacteria bacterium]